MPKNYSDVSELLGKRFALSQPTLHSLVVYWKEEANLSKESRAMISLWHFQLDASFRIYVFLFTLFAINILNCRCLTFSNSINPVFPNVNWTLKCQSIFRFDIFLEVLKSAVLRIVVINRSYLKTIKFRFQAGKSQLLLGHMNCYWCLSFRDSVL